MFLLCAARPCAAVLFPRGSFAPSRAPPPFPLFPPSGSPCARPTPFFPLYPRALVVVRRSSRLSGCALRGAVGDKGANGGLGALRPASLARPTARAGFACVAPARSRRLRRAGLAGLLRLCRRASLRGVLFSAAAVATAVSALCSGASAPPLARRCPRPVRPSGGLRPPNPPCGNKAEKGCY